MSCHDVLLKCKSGGPGHLGYLLHCVQRGNTCGVCAARSAVYACSGRWIGLRHFEAARAGLLRRNSVREVDQHIYPRGVDISISMMIMMLQCLEVDVRVAYVSNLHDRQHVVPSVDLFEDLYASGGATIELRSRPCGHWVSSFVRSDAGYLCDSLLAAPIPVHGSACKEPAYHALAERIVAEIDSGRLLGVLALPAAVVGNCNDRGDLATVKRYFAAAPMGELLSRTLDVPLLQKLDSSSEESSDMGFLDCPGSVLSDAWSCSSDIEDPWAPAAQDCVQDEPPGGVHCAYHGICSVVIAGPALSASASDGGWCHCCGTCPDVCFGSISGAAIAELQLPPTPGLGETEAIGSQTSVNEQAVPCTPCAKTSVLQGIETGLHVDSQDRPAQAQKSDKYKAGRQRHRRLQRLAAKAMGRKRFLSHLAALPVTSAEDFEVPCPGMPVDGHSGSHARPLGVSRVAGRSSRRQPRHAVCDGHEGPASVFEDSRQGESPSQSDNPWKQIPGLL